MPPTTSPSPADHTVENVTSASSGWIMLLVNLGLVLLGLITFISGLVSAAEHDRFSWLILFGPPIALFGIIMLCGHFTLQPNESRVMILFGHYHGSIRQSGFFWANPFYARSRGRIDLAGPAHKNPQTGRTETPHRTLSSKISLRSRNFISEKIKVNDKRGNPVELAAVVVWRVADTARAAFDVDDYESYVQIQSESALRHIASLYSYDHSEEDEPTLRDSADEVALALRTELQARLEKAGVAVDEARLTHLAYAPEIAQAMLRRQQAEAVIAARQKIVHGAVSMVDMALRELADKAVVQLDDERKAAMVSNLLVVLCAESEATPVINTGTLYN
ncbi:MAG: SPFH domain-containing protein [Verrucomicrobiaceae bacterium]|nr:SPFH domain-containing protein [Verrucomicrobiaceae bacterium]